MQHAFLNEPWYAVGQDIPGFAARRINETATRARAGLLNLISATTIALLVFAPEVDPVIYVGPYVIFDMFSAALLGLTPVTPTGVLGTALTLQLRPQWKPVAPKRFAWLLGGTLGVTCLIMRLFQVSRGWILGVVGTCFVLTWAEAVLGFCVGCFLHSLLFECQDCDIPYVRQ